MQKKKVFKIEDSNVEGIGTEADKNCRETAAATEKAWKKVKPDKAGLYCWRIEKFKVKANADAKNGIFFDDDSYIILNVKKNEDEKIEMDVHFWLGTTTSQDEAGTAAYKTVELDDHLGQLPIQHREVSKNESKMFLGYFPDGIRIQSGGIESGFNQVKPEEYTPRLLWIKGNKNIRVVQVDIEIKNLNSGDVFILDTGLILYQYQGKKAGKNEKHQAGKLQRMIDDERKGKPEINVWTQTDKPDDDIGMFWSYFQNDLKGEDIKEGTIVPADKQKELIAKIPEHFGASDEKWEMDTEKRLMQLSDSDGELKFTEVAKGKISKDKLNSDDVFIFDIGCEVYVWIGKNASKQEKDNGFKYCSQYLKSYDRPLAMPCTKIFEGGENEVFEGSFD